MKVAIINQHVENWGDEAAFLGFTSALASLGCEVSHVFTNSSRHTFQGYVSHSHATIFPARFTSASDKLIALLVLRLPFLNRIIYLSKRYRHISRVLSSASAVCVGPGGENIGVYKDYFYLLVLQLALNNQKKILFAGSSFNTSDNDGFDAIALRILSKCKVLAREDISYSYLISRGIDAKLCSDNALYLRKFFPDCFGLLNSSRNISFLQDEDYTVFVPNCLWSWHPRYKNPTAKRFLKQLIDTIFKSLSLHGKIVILPQTYPYPNDIEDFDMYIEEYNAMVIPNLPSLEQISVIANSKAVVGMRYHSIVFSALANKRCFSIGYERKITGFNKKFFAGLGILDLTSSSSFDMPFVLPPIDEFPTPNMDLIDIEISNLLSLHSSFMFE
jgi:colanic acid/amylovoran biosynthesis protein